MPTGRIATKWFGRASLLGAVMLATLPAAIDAVRADEFPVRPITVLVPFAPGGSSDIVMRLIAQKASESIKQPIVIENRPGAAGNVAALAIKNAPPDGYLLMMGHTGTHAINPSLYRDLKFDPIKDFQPITALIAFNNILVVPQVSPAKSVDELVALARSRPDGLSYGSQGVGTGGHLLGEMLARQSGAKFVHVPYRGIAPAVTDTVAGRMDLLFSSYISAAGHIESGRLRMLAIAGSERNPAIPQVPTMAEAGYPGVQMQQWFGLFAPAGTPAAVIGKLNAEFVKALQHDEVRGTLVQQLATVIAGTPEDFAVMIARDIGRLGQVVRDSGATVQD
jgi:tripartite-type tricarboxylate transporter receptor subunit TctC